MEWTEEKILKFIDLYKEKEILWNSKHPSHYNKSVKNCAWGEIAEQLGTSVDECKRKIVSLLSSLRRERARIRKSRLMAGSDKTHVYKSSWFAYKSFLFLIKQRDKFRIPTYTLKGEGDSSEFDVQENDIDYEAAAEALPNSSRKRKKVVENEKPKGNKPQENSVVPVQELQEPAPTTSKHDECQAYGMFIAAKLRSYSSYTRSAVQHSISNILFKADRGCYEKNYEQSSHNIASTDHSGYATVTSFSPEPPELVPIEINISDNHITKAEIEYSNLH